MAADPDRHRLHAITARDLIVEELGLHGGWRCHSADYLAYPLSKRERNDVPVPTGLDTGL